MCVFAVCLSVCVFVCVVCLCVCFNFRPDLHSINKGANNLTFAKFASNKSYTFSRHKSQSYLNNDIG